MPSLPPGRWVSDATVTAGGSWEETLELIPERIAANFATACRVPHRLGANRLRLTVWIYQRRWHAWQVEKTIYFLLYILYNTHL